MDIARFELEFWLNPLDDKAEYNFGSSCCKPVTVGEMLELTGTDREEFFREVEGMSLHYGYFDGMPRLKRAIAALYDGSVAPEMVISVHGGTGATAAESICAASSYCGKGLGSRSLRFAFSGIFFLLSSLYIIPPYGGTKTAPPSDTA